MIRKIVIVLLLFLHLFAQEEQKTYLYETYKNNFFVGYGIGILEPNILSSQQDYSDMGGSYSNIGPVYFKYEYRVSPLVGVGFNLAYISHEGEYVDNLIVVPTGDFLRVSRTINSLSALMRVNLHLLQFEDNVDLYIGAGMGARSVKCTEESNRDVNNPYPDPSICYFIIPLGFDMTVGLRLFITDNLAFFSEVGIAKSAMQFGISTRF